MSMRSSNFHKINQVLKKGEKPWSNPVGWLLWVGDVKGDVIGLSVVCWLTVLI